MTLRRALTLTLVIASQGIGGFTDGAQAMPAVQRARRARRPVRRKQSTPDRVTVPQSYTMIFREREPKVGMRLPEMPSIMGVALGTPSGPAKIKGGEVYGTGPLEIGYPAEWSGISYMITINDERVITSVSTHDPKFRTPEGLAIGDTAEKVLQAGAGPVEKGSEHHFTVRLPSGWHASFSQVDYDAQDRLIEAKDATLRPSTRISGFSQRH